VSPVAFHVGGDAELTHTATLYQPQRARDLDTLLVLAHGAGAGQAHPFMVRHARGLADRGLHVVTFDFPYIAAGRRAPDRTPVLEDAFRRVIVAAAAHRHVHASRLFLGGKSMGGRMATHLAAAPTAWPAEAPPLDGVVVLGYPLNPPRHAGAPAGRVAHLLAITVPTLIIQGTRDSFGGPDTIRAAITARGAQPLVTIHPVEAADHSFQVLKSRGISQEDTDAAIWDRILQFVQSPRQS
jgi:uncharacterized protein